jgi:hypothetical protein
MSSNPKYIQILAEMFDKALFTKILNYTDKYIKKVSFEFNKSKLIHTFTNTYYGYITYFVIDREGFKNWYHLNKKNMSELTNFYTFYVKVGGGKDIIKKYNNYIDVIGSVELDKRVTNYEYMMLKCFQHEIYYSQSYLLDYENSLKFYKYCKNKFKFTIEEYCYFIELLEQFGDDYDLYNSIYSTIKKVIT